VIPVSLPEVGSGEEAAVLDTLRSGMLAMGPRTEAFERAWADYCGVRHAVFLANGTLALEALLEASGIGPGDEVITVAFTFNATVSAVLRRGARPVFVDVREDDFTMDPAAVEAAITERTRAILPVHLYGLMADMAPLADIARHHSILLIEDAAQAHGASYRGRRAGCCGPAMFSTYATKNLQTGEGGLVTTDDDHLAAELRLLRNHGMPARHRHQRLGTNLRPTDLAAALGLAGLERLDARNEQRRRNAAGLSAGLSGYLTPRVPDGREHAWHQYTMRFPGERDRVARDLAERGVGSIAYYPVPVHRQAYLRRAFPDVADVSLPVTERLATEVLSLPVRPNLSDAEVETVIGAVRAVATPVLAGASA
jgi:dTDP-4-amino-4,6-dideoxygalactose transaminase